MLDTLDDYLDAAKAANPAITSDNRLSKALRTSATAVAAWRHGKHAPNDEMMLRVADLAGADRRIALLRLNLWRAPTNDARAVYWAMLKELGGAAGGRGDGDRRQAVPLPHERRARQSGNNRTSILRVLNIMRLPGARRARRVPRATAPGAASLASKRYVHKTLTGVRR